MKKIELDAAAIQNLIETIKGLPEKGKRLFLGRQAISLGYGGISMVARAIKVSRNCIARGVAEVLGGASYKLGDRNRKPGGGRISVEESHRRLVAGMGFEGKSFEEAMDICHVVDAIVDNASYGDPMTNRAWINVTVKAISEAIFQQFGRRYSHTSIKKIVKKLGYSLQKNQKYNQVGKQSPNRNEQFEHIASRKLDYLNSGDPIISIDTKAKEKVGNFANKGREYRKKGDPQRVLDHDFHFTYAQIYPDGSSIIPQEAMGLPAIIAPYGVYCLNSNSAHVTLGISSDTSEFAADAISNWWNKAGKEAFPNAKRILILADGGGSNRSRGFLWKEALQQLADDLNLKIEICHYPPGTSKYNPIERKCWSYISMSWAAKPLSTVETMREYISHTTTSIGFRVTCEINSKIYLSERQKKQLIAKGLVPDGINDELLRSSINVSYFYEEGDMHKWNYSITPHSPELCWRHYRLPESAA